MQSVTATYKLETRRGRVQHIGEHPVLNVKRSYQGLIIEVPVTAAAAVQTIVATDSDQSRVDLWRSRSGCADRVSLGQIERPHAAGGQNPLVAGLVTGIRPPSTAIQRSRR
jgi:hypothetical protein